MLKQYSSDDLPGLPDWSHPVNNSRQVF